jgi:hypothetical protein
MHFNGAASQDIYLPIATFPALIVFPKKRK